MEKAVSDGEDGDSADCSPVFLDFFRTDSVSEVLVSSLGTKPSTSLLNEIKSAADWSHGTGSMAIRCL